MTDVRKLHVDVRSLSIPGLTPVAAYRALRNGSGALIVCGGAAPYAFAALDPLETIAIDDDPGLLQRIRAAFEDYRRALTAPIAGYGFVCVFAYDAALSLQHIVARPRALRLFGDAYAFVPGTWLWFEHGRTTLTGLSRTPAERAATAERLDAYESRLRAADPRAPNVSSPENAGEDGSPIEASLSRREYLARVVKAQRAVRNGDVYQLVLGIGFSKPYGGDALDVYERLTARNPSPYSYAIERDGRALIGASPEFLVRLRQGRADLRPLAGTRPRGQTPDRDAELAAELFADPKERAEHAMLVDLGRNDLSRVCRAGSVRVERTLSIERFSHVMHLASEVSGQLLPRRDAFDLFGAAFPAGTVTGAPKRRAMELIARLEPTARDVYAGSVAHFRFDGSLDSALTLRSIALLEGKAFWQAAAGIVYRSIPAAEYAEVLAKAEVARAVLADQAAAVA